ncbi:hypothetical protein B0J12DRAFT_61793 [Macrophomina phaseolina]|uniref:Myb-like domain-containing protein n=1 Tax=Macrophomina phaseolina TaxID=35725 RepID=A0ABQ8GCK0_9PEZI|nr:hypothetical protein B0J12DRAFT_61793 [Macrophomina phaseolina]
MVKNKPNEAGVKTEDSDRPETPESATAATNGSIPATPITPKTPGSAKRAANDGDENDSPPMKKKKKKGRASPKVPATPRQRKAPTKTPSSARSIATTTDELSTEDRLLLSMKDQGKSWKDIAEVWKNATGVTPAKSSLPNRYARLRANITTMSEMDQNNLLTAKADVESAFEASKWERISQRMQDLGTTKKYSVSVLQKQLQKIGTAANKAQSPTKPSNGAEE